MLVGIRLGIFQDVNKIVTKYIFVLKRLCNAELTYNKGTVHPMYWRQNSPNE